MLGGLPGIIVVVRCKTFTAQFLVARKGYWELGFKRLVQWSNTLGPAMHEGHRKTHDRKAICTSGIHANDSLVEL